MLRLIFILQFGFFFFFLPLTGSFFFSYRTVLLLIRIILEYCQCVDNIPSITTDMLTHLSDLLKYFNSRSCQLVLGAGALQVVGLKTITTKKLALSSRCLQLIVHYIPVIGLILKLNYSLSNITCLGILIISQRTTMTT